MPHSVLIVDDEPAVAAAVGVRLEAAGYHVILAADGLEGIRAADKYAPDIILLDVRMPGIDGFEVRRSLRGNRRLGNIPVIYLTADPVEAARELEYDPAANIFLAKPFEIEELLHVVEQTIAQRVTVIDFSI